MGKPVMKMIDKERWANAEALGYSLLSGAAMV